MDYNEYVTASLHGTIPGTPFGVQICRECGETWPCQHYESTAEHGLITPDAAARADADFRKRPRAGPDDDNAAILEQLGVTPTERGGTTMSETITESRHAKDADT